MMPTDRPLRILLVGDASNFHPTLAAGLRRFGAEVTIASDGCSEWMQTRRQIDLRRRLPGKLGGLDLWARLKLYGKRLSGYDIVNIASQDFVSLKPARVKAFFDFLKAHNGGVFYNALGTDWRYVSECRDPATELVYNEILNNGKPTPYYLENPETIDAWTRGELLRVGQHIYSHVEGAVAALWEYHVALRRYFDPSKIAYGGIPIDTGEVGFSELSAGDGPVRILLGRHRARATSKGAEILEAAARSIADRYPGRVELVMVENRPYREFVDIMRSSHIVLDQIYSYTPATTALLAMAMGRVTVSGGEEQFYDFIGEDTLRPVINVSPDYESVYRAIEDAVLHPGGLAERGRQGRRFVEKHNDALVVARRNLEFWTRQLSKQ